jgi:hypothetical protein
MKHAPHLALMLLICLVVMFFVPIKIYIIFGAISGFFLIPSWKLLFDRKGLTKEHNTDLDEIKKHVGIPYIPSGFSVVYFASRYLFFGLACTVLWPVMVVTKIIESVA